MDSQDERIHIALPHSRRINPKAGIVISRHRDLSSLVHGSRDPLTVRLEVALLDGGEVVYRDTEYMPYDVIVELDGRAGHADSTSRWRDMTRDNAAATSGKLTLRFGYQLVSEPCLAASQVAAALQLRGWQGSPHPCSPTCALSR